jgi:hypothetical protein
MQGNQWTSVGMCNAVQDKQDHARQCRTMLKSTGPCRTKQANAGQSRTMQDNFRQYKPVHDKEDNVALRSVHDTPDSKSAHLFEWTCLNTLNGSVHTSKRSDARLFRDSHIHFIRIKMPSLPPATRPYYPKYNVELSTA